MLPLGGFRLKKTQVRFWELYPTEVARPGNFVSTFCVFYPFW